MNDAEQIVQAVLEAEEDFKEVFFPGEEGVWEQIDGDWGDPWVYGGTFWNGILGQMFHFYGIENEKEVEPEDVEVPPYTLEKIKKMVHDPDLDQAWAQEDPAWLEKQLKQEEMEVERKVQEYQYAKAAFINTRKEYQWEEIKLDEEFPSELERYIEPVKKQFDPETVSEFDSWPLQNRVAEVLNYAGWEQYADRTVMMSKREASRLLGMSL